MVKPCLGVLVQGFSEDHPAVDISGIRNRPLVSMGDGNLKEGQRVLAGERVGTVGTTGCSTGIHLHLEIRKNRKLSDPEAIFGRLEYKPKTNPN
tara:strand:- start:44 stop:325 length:282 start_codon:yes stop_codon:yes gene_type:complete